MIKYCEKCKLCKTRNKICNGRGNPQAKIWFIGRDPGSDEDEQGLPFVGRAGKHLSKLLAEVNLSEEHDIYITNLVKCHTPDNRGPDAEEIAACSEYLTEELDKYKPTVILALGKEVMSYFVEEFSTMPMSEIRMYNKYVNHHWVVPTYHPSYLVRCGGTQDNIFIGDLKHAMRMAGVKR